MDLLPARELVWSDLSQKAPPSDLLVKLTLLHILVGFWSQYVKMEGAKFLDPWTHLRRVLLHRKRPGTDFGH